MSSVDELKTLGNKAFTAGDHAKAVEYFTQAINLDSSNHVLFSNRSAAYASLKDYTHALEDAEKTTSIKPDWAKGWGRKGAALMGQQRFMEAKMAYSEGLKLDAASPLLKKGLDEAETSLQGERADGGIGNLFKGNIWERVAGNPKLSHLLAQRDFVEKVKMIQSNPALLNDNLQDPRIMTLVMTLMGIDADVAGGAGGEAQQEPVKREATPPPPPPAEPEPMELDEDAQKKQDALAAKERGNAFYKKKQFEEALQEYSKAQELDPDNMSYYNNEAAVYFEMGKFDECIAACEKAVDVGRDHRADFKLIARAFGRIGNAYAKMNKFEEAIKFYNKSLTEHRTADILEKLRGIEREKKEQERLAYHSIELSDKAREEGNEFFKKGEWVKGVERYTEAIKRNDTDPRAYSNRAACYTKLMAFSEALKDCEKCIALDSTFVKGYIRKAAIEFLKKDYSTCLTTCEQALKQDTQGKHRGEIEAQMSKCYMATQKSNEDLSEEEVLKRASQDPEVQAIMSDPIMRQILTQMQEDPRAAQDHLKNPMIAAKIKKLVAAGILRIG